MAIEAAWLCPKYTYVPEEKSIYNRVGYRMAIINSQGVVCSSPENRCCDEFVRAYISKSTCSHCKEEQERESKFYNSMRQMACMVISPLLLGLVIGIICLTHPYWTGHLL